MPRPIAQGRARSATGSPSLGIACDLESKAAYAYASDPACRRDEIAVEAEAARRVGFDAQVLTGRRFLSIPQRPCAFPIRPSSILQNTWSDWHWRWKRPAAAFSRARGSPRSIAAVAAVAAADGVLDVEHVVVATNFPFTGPVEYDRSTQPRGHTAMAFRAREEAAIDGMFIAIDEPRCSLRMGCDDEGLLLVVLGLSFKTGQERDVAGRFRELDRWVHENSRLTRRCGAGSTRITTPPIAFRSSVRRPARHPGSTSQPVSMPGASATAPPPEC